MSENLSTKFVMEVKAMIGAPEQTGDSDLGQRQFIPLTGGSFEGPDIRGEVIPGGADWQLFRSDGVLEIKAIYAIRTDDGAVINIENIGIADQGANPPYVRTRYTFRAPKGKYEWLNKRLFVGSIALGPEGDHVIVKVYQVL